MEIIPAQTGYYTFALNDKLELHRKREVIAWKPFNKHDGVHLVGVTVEGETTNKPLLMPGDDVLLSDGTIVPLSDYVAQQRTIRAARND